MTLASHHPRLRGFLLAGVAIAAPAIAGDTAELNTSVNYSNIYVISIAGTSSDQECVESQSLAPGIVEIFEGVSAAASCEWNNPQAEAWTDCFLGVARVRGTEEALFFDAEGGGEAHADGDADAFSRHTIHSIFTVQSTQDARIGIHWSLHASGLGDAFVRLRDPSNMSVLQEEVSSYILPVSEEGTMFVDMESNEAWTLTIYTDHQASDFGSGPPKFAVGGALVSVTMALQQGHTGDLNGDGIVDGADLALVLVSWGVCEGCPADIDGTGLVDGGDLAMVLASWSA